MKNLIFSILFIALSTGIANGQMMHMHHDSGMMKYGISGGLNIASNNCVLEADDVGSADYVYGFVGNIFIDHKIIPKLDSRFGVGVVMGGSDTNMPVNGVSTTYETRTVYLDFPILAKYSIFGFGHHSVYALGGINFGYLLSAKTNDEDMMDNMKKFDLGLLGGVGISMPVASHTFFIEAKYNYGLANTSDIEGEELKNRGIRLTAGITL
jgi:hypothetical protein